MGRNALGEGGTFVVRILKAWIEPCRLKVGEGTPGEVVRRALAVYLGLTDGPKKSQGSSVSKRGSSGAKEKEKIDNERDSVQRDSQSDSKNGESGHAPRGQRSGKAAQADNRNGEARTDEGKVEGHAGANIYPADGSVGPRECGYMFDGQEHPKRCTCAVCSPWRKKLGVSLAKK